MSQSSDNAIRVITDEKTHFPLIEIKDIGSLTLWPITKIQFEMYISQVNQYGDLGYEEILKCHPRVSYQKFDKNNYEQLFITGVNSEEALAFSKWFGGDFRIPTVEEWRRIYNRLLTSRYALTVPSDISYPAKKIWEGMIKISRSPIKFSLMQDGVFDWVISGNNYGGLGLPRDNFLHHTFNPLIDDPVKTIKSEGRLPYFGFRLIKGSHYD